MGLERRIREVAHEYPTARWQRDRMKLLVIGGTQFLGRHIAKQAVARGHEVTLFNRGNRPPPDGVTEVIHGDRNADLSALSGGNWHAVIDNIAFFPRQVTELAQALGDRVGHYTFVSTVSVYADQDRPGLHEGSSLLALDDPSTEEVTNDTYGALKAACEKALVDIFGGTSLIVRPGLIVGPDDPTDRFTYWPARVAKGGSFIAPVGPDMPAQWIDVRDLAAWMLDATEAALEGTFNAVSEPGRFTIGDVIYESMAASGSGAEPVWVPEEFLLEHGVGPFIEMPLWIPGDGTNFWRIDGSRAKAAGLTVRPAAETVGATLAWYRDTQRGEMRTGLEPEREARLLAEWRAKMADDGRSGNTE